MIEAANPDVFDSGRSDVFATRSGLCTEHRSRAREEKTCKQRFTTSRRSPTTTR